MDELDRRIAAALAEDDLGLPVDAREPGFFSLAFSTMRGPQGWVTWVLMIVQTVMFLAAVWAGWNFYVAADALPAIKWGLTAATLAILATQLKLALVPQMQANRVILALRRLELRLAAQK
ncbi:MAG: hypothetical protein EA385_08790 [Salinarimonadaceae bacterium]|nr:MAG: hypothetical protein EA385_08790 [Salinarimonadaceae bacterium]